MQNFNTMGLPQSLMHSLEHMQFIEPTDIQAQAIPPALEGHDVLGTAQTGTGKTAAFGIPLVVHLLKNSDSSALILTPTRELAVQVLAMLTKLIGKSSPMKTALLIGGEPMPKQFNQLKNKPRLIVGTPGRINDHLSRGSVKINNATFLVLDEIDRMLDMGFEVQLEKIAHHLPKVRQTLMFSATLPDNILKLSSKYLTDPVRVSVGSTIAPSAQIKQENILTSDAEKYGILVTQLDQRTGSIIVFVKTKHGADKLADKLYRENHSVDAIHGDLRQSKRERVIKGFREKKTRILIATDVAARGLDISHIEHVVNYDLPQCPEDYIHRIGRTGRAGAEGHAINLITSQDNAKWRAIHRLMNPDAKFEGGHPDRPSGNKSRNGGRFGKSGGGSKFGGNGRPARSFDDKPRSFSDKPRSFSDRPRSFDDKPRARFDDSKPRSFSDKPRSFSDRPRSFDDKPRARFDDSKPRSFSDKPRSFSDRPRSFSDKPRSFSDKPRSFSDRPRSFEDKPRARFDDSKPRSFSDKPRSFSDRPRSFDDKPRARFDDSKPRSFSDKPRGKFGSSPSGSSSYKGKKPLGLGGAGTFKKKFEDAA